MDADRCLIVNADDFGRTSGINDGVVRAFEHGIVTSASLMVRWPAARAAARYARAHASLSVGLHVDLGEWTWREGGWRRRYEVVDSADRSAVAREVAAQLARFRDLMGEDPTHLDSHQQAHRREPLRSVLRDLARDLQVPLRHESPEVSTWLGFYGETRTGRPLADAIAPGRLIEWMSSLGPDPVELRCHPAGVPDADDYRDARCLETRTLCDPRVRAAVRQLRIELRSFRAVPVAPWEGRDALACGDAAAAVRIFERAAQRGRDEVWPWLWLARAHGAAGEARASLQALLSAVRRASASTAVLACAVDLLGVEDEAVRRAYADAAAAATGCDAHGLRLLAARLASLHSPPAARARALVDGVRPVGPVDVAPGPAAAPVRVEAARRLAAGDAAAAWQAAGDAPDAAGPFLLARIGEALQGHGHVRASVRAYEAALALTPGHPDLREARDAAAGEWLVLSGRWTPPDLPAIAGGPRADRVLHVVGPSLPGVQSGYTFRTHAIARAQRAAGVDASAVTELGFPGDGAPAPAGRTDIVDGVPCHRLEPGCEVPIRLDDRLTAHARALHRLVCDCRPAVLHAASDYRNALPALAAGRAAGLPVIYEMRGFWEDTWRAGLPATAVEGERHGLLQARELACALEADAVVTLSEAMRDDLVARGVPAGRIDVIPNGVDADAFRPRARDAALAARLGLAPAACVVGYVSTLNGYEGIDVLLQALGLLVRRGADVSGLVVGDGPDRARLEALAADLGLSGRVRFAGRVPHGDIARWYSLLDVFVVPRLDRRVARLVTPLKPLEAMAMAIPVVASDLPALGELVEDDRTGRLAPPGDADGLASTLAPLIAAPVLRRRLGDAARAFVLRSRTWSHVGRRALDLYRRLAPAPAGEGLCL